MDGGAWWATVHGVANDFCFIGYAKAFDCVDHHKLENTRPPDLPPKKSVRKQQLELDMEQQTGSK